MSNELTTREYKDQMTNTVMSELQGISGRKIALPKNYAPQNALAAALLILEQTVDKNGKPVLQVCSSASVKQSLLDMILAGLNPGKKQGYFIAYGTKLSWMTSYFGHIAQAKAADPNIVDAFAICVYQGDEFVYEIKRGHKVITKHIQKPENVISTKITGAYATIVYKDDTEISDYMSIDQIHTSWQFGQAKGESNAHKRTPEEMCKRTVLNRLVKPIINGSDDSELDAWDELDNEIRMNGNKEFIDITPPEEMQQNEPELQAAEVMDIPEPAQPEQMVFEEPGF